ncbi:orotate phosphoribosyltransferase [Sediminibacillus massiliensis]|uniref:orotate phosphoribosyltransferase n=1 Tax=Sediminibacillus massiliensis TaxID=1926277 RepID=UPI0009885CA8|nr:orotate phosphoribosyltransferase [Sediminibacillus massiliensis]
MTSLNIDIAKQLHKIEAVKLSTENPFTWTSGIKSPIYCDNRLTMSDMDLRNKISDAFVRMIDEMPEKPDVIAGCATAGIPHAAWLSEKLGLPMVYVRSKAKSHGKQNQIEGKVEKGQKAIVIEDLISTGGSSIKAAEALQQEGVHVISVLAIFTYGLRKAEAQFAGKAIPLKTITSFDTLLDVLEEENHIEEDEKTKLLTWRNSFQ